MRWLFLGGVVRSFYSVTDCVTELLWSLGLLDLSGRFYGDDDDVIVDRNIQGPIPPVRRAPRVPPQGVAGDDPAYVDMDLIFVGHQPPPVVSVYQDRSALCPMRYFFHGEVGWHTRVQVSPLLMVTHTHHMFFSWMHLLSVLPVFVCIDT
jgi:hypothetical protein